MISYVYSTKGTDVLHLALINGFFSPLAVERKKKCIPYNNDELKDIVALDGIR